MIKKMIKKRGQKSTSKSGAFISIKKGVKIDNKNESCNGHKKSFVIDKKFLKLIKKFVAGKKIFVGDKNIKVATPTKKL